jgi:hypothetical protein
MKARFLVIAVAVSLVFLGGVSTAQAAARVFVSVNGTDTGDCSNVNSPCRTLNFAISAVSAGGEVIVVATGSYAGASVTKSVKIDVPTGVVAFSASPITVNAAASDVVVIRGMTLKSVTAGTGKGIDFMAGAVLSVENCVLDSWSIGINIASPNSQTFVSGTVSRNNGGSGLELNDATALVSVVNSRFENNGFVGGFCGVSIRSGKASVRASVASGNAFGFCTFDTANAELTVEDSLAANNGNSGIEVDTGVVRASDNTVTDNGIGLRQFNPATLESRGNNTVRGNGTNTLGTITAITGS